MINNIRIAPSTLYGHGIQLQSEKEQENIEFSELMINTSQNRQNNPQNQINLCSLGAPAGFCADISMLNEADANELGIIQLNSPGSLLM